MRYIITREQYKKFTGKQYSAFSEEDINLTDNNEDNWFKVLHHALGPDDELHVNSPITEIEITQNLI